jgi:hypothetical protein
VGTVKILKRRKIGSVIASSSNANGPTLMFPRHQYYQHERNIAEFSITEGSLESLIEQETINRDTEGEVETTVEERARELVVRIHVLVEWHLAETIKGRILSGTIGLIDDEIVEGLVPGVIRGDHGRGEDRVLQSVTMRIRGLWNKSRS